MTGIRQELLNKLGRREDALESAWTEFVAYPSKYSYDRLRKYIPKEDFRHWHERAIQEAKKTSLSAFIEICTAAKEWVVLSGIFLMLDMINSRRSAIIPPKRRQRGL